MLYENVVTLLMRPLSRPNVLCVAVKVADGLAHCSFDRHSGLVGNEVAPAAPDIAHIFLFLPELERTILAPP